MATYVFEVECRATGTVEVEADNYDEAERKALGAKNQVEELESRWVEDIVCLIDGPDDE